eukprot:CAMPEP_0171704864 /NCGR_PEP_ID=MMETSP0991-20121206/12883_1 /TAXON_ID=483369 /ORGANISM="non described non described, Strain CCMP2098" /LENGTH=546 /DNA_ID=CAMNT_0012294355 /DNA_START=575 /DNA_END=2216 /DNA_ORIENTATION=-
MYRAHRTPSPAERRIICANSPSCTKSCREGLRTEPYCSDTCKNDHLVDATVSFRGRVRRVAQACTELPRALDSLGRDSLSRKVGKTTSSNQEQPKRKSTLGGAEVKKKQSVGGSSCAGTGSGCTGMSGGCNGDESGHPANSKEQTEIWGDLPTHELKEHEKTFSLIRRNQVIGWDPFTAWGHVTHDQPVASGSTEGGVLVATAAAACETPAIDEEGLMDPFQWQAKNELAEEYAEKGISRRVDGLLLPPKSLDTQLGKASWCLLSEEIQEHLLASVRKDVGESVNRTRQADGEAVEAGVAESASLAGRGKRDISVAEFYAYHRVFNRLKATRLLAEVALPSLFYEENKRESFKTLVARKWGAGCFFGAELSKFTPESLTAYLTTPFHLSEPPTLDTRGGRRKGNMLGDFHIGDSGDDDGNHETVEKGDMIGVAPSSSGSPITLSSSPLPSSTALPPTTLQTSLSSLPQPPSSLSPSPSSPSQPSSLSSLALSSHSRDSSDPGGDKAKAEAPVPVSEPPCMSTETTNQDIAGGGDCPQVNARSGRCA